MKKVLTIIAALFFAMQMFSEESKADFLEITNGKEMKFVEILNPKNFDEVLNPRNASLNYRITKAYVSYFENIVGEIALSVFEDNGISEDVQKEKYEKKVIDIFNTTFHTLNGEEIALYKDGSNLASYFNADECYKTDVLNKDYFIFPRKHFCTCIFVKYGMGIVVCTFLTDNMKFFAVKDSEESYRLNSDVFECHKNPLFKFSENPKTQNSIKRGTLSDFSHFELVKSEESMPIEFTENDSIKESKNPPLRMSELKYFKTFKISSEMYVSYIVFKDLGNWKKKNKTELDDLMNFCIKEIVGYIPQKKATVYKKNDVKKEFNADFGCTLSISLPSSNNITNCDYLNIEFFHKSDKTLVVRIVTYKSPDKFFPTFFKSDIYHSFKFID